MIVETEMNIQRRYSDMKLAESWFHMCKVLLSRFHFISNGSALFRFNWDNTKNVKFAKLDEAQVKFMQKTQAMVAAKGQSASKLTI
jgi:hypothetical protein